MPLCQRTCFNSFGAVLGRTVSLTGEQRAARPLTFSLLQVFAGRRVAIAWLNTKVHLRNFLKDIGRRIEAQGAAQGMGAHGHEEVAVGEGRMLTLHFAAAGLSLCNVYVPNSGRGLVRLDYRMQWDQAFAAWCAGQQAAGRQLLVVGDMNVAHQPIDLANPKTNVKNAGFTPEEREQFSMLLEKGGLEDVFRQRHEGEAGHYSFWSFMGGARARNVGWRLDYALASSGLGSSIAHVCYDHTFAASDHCPMHIDLAKSLFPAKCEATNENKKGKQKSIASFFDNSSKAK